MWKGASDRLTAEITSKANGVFLWVVLVTKSLLNGLRNYDHISDLLRRLEDLPGDLEELYDHMLFSVDKQYREQCSRTLQTILRSIKIEVDFPLTVLQLSFVEEDDNQNPLDAPLRSLPQTEEDWRLEATEGRLRSRCGGLAEVQDLVKFDDGHKSGNSIGFLHRSVIEYLQSGHTWETICSWTPVTEVDIDHALLNSSLCELKVKNPDTKHLIGKSRAYGCVLRILAYLSKMRSLHHHRDIYLNQLIRTAEQYWPDASCIKATEMEETNAATADGCRRFGLTYPTTFVFSVACQGPSRLLRELLKTYPETIQFPAYLLMHFFENVPTSVQKAIARSIEIFYPSPHQVLDVFKSTVQSLNAHWKHVVRCDHQTNWSIIKFTLYRCILLGEFDDIERRNFLDYSGTDPLFGLLYNLVSHDSYTQVGITVVHRSGPERIEGKYEITASDIVRHLISRAPAVSKSISSIVGGRTQTGMLLEALETTDSGLRIHMSTTRSLSIFSRLKRVDRIEDYYRVYRS